MTLEEIQERLAKWFKKGVVYNISEGKQFTVKEQPMANKPTTQDAMNAIGALTTVVNDLSITVNDLSITVNGLVKTVDNLAIEMRAGFERLDAKIDNIVKQNNLKTE